MNEDQKQIQRLNQMQRVTELKNELIGRHRDLGDLSAWSKTVCVSMPSRKAQRAAITKAVEELDKISASARYGGDLPADLDGLLKRLRENVDQAGAEVVKAS